MKPLFGHPVSKYWLRPCLGPLFLAVGPLLITVGPLNKPYVTDMEMEMQAFPYL